jgi:drug/metabolite transporter (DMT)-like permease
LQEPLGWQQWLGGGFIMLGIGLIGGRAQGNLSVNAKV